MCLFVCLPAGDVICLFSRVCWGEIDYGSFFFGKLFFVELEVFFLILSYLVTQLGNNKSYLPFLRYYVRVRNTVNIVLHVEI